MEEDEVKMKVLPKDEGSKPSRSRRQLHSLRYWIKPIKSRETITHKK